ncbi:MAG TPA: helix-turn-helix domain-containing protein [Candidatus Paceibacterota bacterium]|nr:helix-turn-helix domain-containing protein [Candidatus Paceibacterota bacterium]
MLSKVQEKKRALELRRQGYSYREILAEVRVAKSTLSSWIKDLPLSADEEKYLKERVAGNISNGRVRAASALHRRRIDRDNATLIEARENFEIHKSNPFFSIGVALYWAEGTKRNSGFSFINSDLDMIVLMIKWIEEFLGVEKQKIKARLYTHEPFARDNNEIFWSKETGVPLENFGKTIFKPTGLLVKKRPLYRGCLRLELSKVSYLRTMLFWQQMLVEQYRKEG